MTRYNLVVSTNRSGSSAMMLALKMSGIKIIGYKYPGHRGDIDLEVEPDEKMREGNPTGFWEIYSVTTKGLKGKLKYEGNTIKIMLDALLVSDPNFINKILLMFRHPRKILSSHLKAKPELKDNFRWKMNVWAYNNNMLVALNWIKNRKIPYKIIIYEELVEYPEQVLENVCDWLGEGDFKLGIQAITKNLSRSKMIDYQDECLDIAEDIYYKAKYRDLRALYEYDLKYLSKKTYEIYLEIAQNDNNFNIKVKKI